MREANGGNELSTWQYLLAAGGTKGLASIATYPHEVVRTRMREAASARYQSMLQSIALIAKEEGRRGLYSGIGPHLLRVVPNTAIMFVSFELLSRHLPAVMEERAWQQHVAEVQQKLQNWQHKLRASSWYTAQAVSKVASIIPASCTGG